MIYLLDTNVCVEFMRGRKQPLTARFQAVPQSDKYLCPIVLGELFYGAYKSLRPSHNLAQVQTFMAYFPLLPFDEVAAQKYGEIRADLARQGLMIGPNDLQIAAIAVVHGVLRWLRTTRGNLAVSRACCLMIGSN